MRKTDLRFLLLYFGCLFIPAISNSRPGPGLCCPPKNKGISPTESVVEKPAFAAMSFNDSILQFPAYEIYCRWDTSIVHPYIPGYGESRDSVQILLQDHYRCGFAPPFLGSVTSGYGPRRRQFHYGIDIKLFTGDTVRCAFEGRVRFAKRNKTYGNVVIVRHTSGLETYYAHLSKIKVKTGDFVNPGQLIGLGGNTGHSFGSHLHFEVRYKGQPINPNALIDFSNSCLRADRLTLHFSTMGKKTPIRRPYVAAPIATAGFYVVKKGDTLYSISKRYGTTPDALTRKNGMRTGAILRIGMRLKCT